MASQDNKGNGYNDGGYSSYEDYLKGAGSAAASGLSDQVQEEVGSMSMTGSPSASQSDAAAGVANGATDTGYGSYDDYLNGQNDVEYSPEGLEVEGDQAGTNTGDGITEARPSLDGSSVEVNGAMDDGAYTNPLLQDGGAVGPSSFSEAEGIGRAGGILHSAKEGLGNMASGAVGGLVSGVKNMFSSGKAKLQGVADRFHMPLKTVAIMAGTVASGGALTLWTLLSGGSSIVKYSDVSNCDLKKMIDEYTADHGAGDDWTEESAKGNAAQIYQILASPDPWSFESHEWNGSEWVPVTIINDGFGFSDEAIAGMLANAYAESSIRPECYEMDYYVHDIHTKNDSGEYKYKMGDILSGGDITTDFVLGRTHHANWDNYTNRMFDIYKGGGASGKGTLRINEATYKWTSDYTGRGNVNQNPGSGDRINQDIAGLEGLYPGTGLWQWTGQRAYNLARFADLQPDPKDADQDGHNDVMYTIEGQLGFLYYEDWGDFSEYGVKGGVSSYKVYDYTGKDAADVLQRMEDDPDKMRSFKILEQEGDVDDLDTLKLKVQVKFGGTPASPYEHGDGAQTAGVLEWGRQNKFEFAGAVTSTGGAAEAGRAYRTLSHSVGNDKTGKGDYIDGNTETGKNAYKGKQQDVDLSQPLYQAQQENDLNDGEDIYDNEKLQHETTNRWPKYVAYVEGGGYWVGDGDDSDGIEYSPESYLKDIEKDENYWEDWERAEDGLKQYIVEDGQGSDNRICERSVCDQEEYERQQPDWGGDETIKIQLADMKGSEGGKDCGQWTIEVMGYAESETNGASDEEMQAAALKANEEENALYPYTQDEAAYTAESKYGSEYAGIPEDGKGSKTRKNTKVQTTRRFNAQTDLPMFKDLYYGHYEYSREWVKDGSEDGGGHWIYYRWTIIDLKKDEKIKNTNLKDIMDRYEDYEGLSVNQSERGKAIDSLRSAERNPEDKYIVGDLTLTAGCEAATECALQFYNKWEGMEGHGSDKMAKDHIRKAGAYYMLIKTSGWKYNNAYAHSVLEMIDYNKTNHEIRDMRLQYVNMHCNEEIPAVKGIAECAMAWAWPKDCPGDNEGFSIAPGSGIANEPWYDHNEPGTDGSGAYTCSKSTSLYCAVHDAVITNDAGIPDSIYSSCDRGVCTAVRAAGADDQFPQGNAANCFNYCSTNPDKWENLGPVRSESAFAMLEPGDLLIAGMPGGGSGGHVMVFVGEDLPKEKWPSGCGSVNGGKYCAVHASHSSGVGSRGPRCDNDCHWIASDKRVFYAFRCRDYEQGSKFKDLAEPLFQMDYLDGSGEKTGWYECGTGTV